MGGTSARKSSLRASGRKWRPGRPGCQKEKSVREHKGWKSLRKLTGKSVKPRDAREGNISRGVRFKRQNPSVG